MLLGSTSNEEPIPWAANTTPLDGLLPEDAGYGPIETTIADVFQPDVGPLVQPVPEGARSIGAQLNPTGSQMTRSAGRGAYELIWADG